MTVGNGALGLVQNQVAVLVDGANLPLALRFCECECGIGDREQRLDDIRSEWPAAFCRKDEYRVEGT
jgi:hypothetical protein